MTKNKEIAKLYADSEFSPDAGYYDTPRSTKIYEFNAKLENSAPTDVVLKEAENLGISWMEEDGGPATLFDANIWSKSKVQKLVNRLKDLGYDSAAVADEHGKLQGTSFIVFDRSKIKPVKGKKK